jgi:hypothetical protein
MCFCGDPYCPSCGPAQGNHYCPHCGAWSADGGCPDPASCQAAEKQYLDATAAQYEWEQQHLSEIQLCLCGLLTDECETPAACEQRAQEIEAEQGWRDELRASGEREGA